MGGEKLVLMNITRDEIERERVEDRNREWKTDIEIGR